MSPAVKSSSNSNSAENKLQATRYFMICKLQLVWSVCDAVGEPGRGVTHLAGAGGHARPPGPTYPWAGLPWGRAAGGQVPVSRGLDVFLYENHTQTLCLFVKLFFTRPQNYYDIYTFLSTLFSPFLTLLFSIVPSFFEYLYPLRLKKIFPGRGDMIFGWGYDFRISIQPVVIT